MPLTAPDVLEVPSTEVLPSALNSSAHDCQLRIGDYNVRLPLYEAYFTG